MPVGHNEYGHMQFDTKRSEMGELLYRLKYSQDRGSLPALIAAAGEFLSRWQRDLDSVIPVPPSATRAVQPVPLLAAGIAATIGRPVEDVVRRRRDAPELKAIYDLDGRLNALEGLHDVEAGALSGKRVLLFDDLFRSGATMNAIATLLRDRGGASEVFALTITRTRSIR
jgi:predicted amidophosphoribosyltransferase